VRRPSPAAIIADSTEQRPEETRGRILDDYFADDECAGELGVAPITFAIGRMQSKGRSPASAGVSTTENPQ
jgi:hypothetical protein